MQNNPFSGYQPYNAYYGNRSPMMYQPYYQQQPQQTPGVAASLVSNRQEAEAAQILFDSTVNVFVDQAHGLIYTKRFNAQTGAADFDVYKLMVRPTGEQASPTYVTTADLDAIREEMRDLEDRIKRGRHAAREEADAE